MSSEYAPTQNPQIMAAIEQILPSIIDTRHYLHQHPELSGYEEQTGALVAERLRQLPFDSIQTGIAGHGVVGILKGGLPGPTFALRADMDALPIQEAASDLPYHSCKPGVMHACGHDGHTSCLLGAATVLSGMKDQIRGTIKFLFQPAEETVGGAEGMCQAGIMDGVESIFALHGWPNLDVGQIGIRPGPMMASADQFDITIRGKGGHAGYPHTTVDPIVTAAQVITALQTLSSREISPVDAVVVSITQVHAGTAYNIIPNEVELKGTVRSLNKAVRDQIEDQMARIIEGICTAFRCTSTFKYNYGTGVVVNDAKLIALVEQVGAAVLGPKNVQFLETPTMGAEDFAYYLDFVPGAMFRLGVGQDVSALHTPTYNFTDGALAHGISMMSHIALNYANVK